MSDSQIKQRKSEHLRIVAEEEVAHRGSNLLDGVRLLHEALPELDLNQLDLGVTFFGKRLAAPLIISSMSGGTRFSRELNHDLAEVAGRHGVAFAVGSQRLLLRHPERLPDFAVRAFIPDGVLLGNIGAVQLPQIPPEQVAELVRRIEGDGVCVHLNPGQELCQVEGDRRFSGLLDRIGRLVEVMDGRVMVKETGAGLSPGTLRRLAAVGVACVDVAGGGGTSWTKVEYHRAPEGDERDIAETFGDWGVPTAVSIVAARAALGGGASVVGSGGIHNGLECARAVAAGADVAGVARAVLLAWQEAGSAGAHRLIQRMIVELRAALLLTGSKDLAALRAAPRVYTGELRQWLSQLGLLNIE